MHEELFQNLIDKKITLAAAESCTGGLASAKIVSYAGISEIYLLGCVTYSNQSKMDILHVSQETLSAFGAVSSGCAAEMAQGVRAASGAMCGIATTGIAGPGGGSKDKPVGLVYIAVSFGTDTIVQELHLSGGRSDIMEQAADKLLVLLKSYLQIRLS